MYFYCRFSVECSTLRIFNICFIVHLPSEIRQYCRIASVISKNFEITLENGHCRNSVGEILIGEIPSYQEKNSARLIAISDEEDISRGIVTLPKLRGQRSYLQAQHRQFRLLKYLEHDCRLLNKKCWLANIVWIALIDDDTRVNVPRLMELLRMSDFTRPLAIGHLLTDVQENRDDLIYHGGGAGMFFTRAAFEIVLPKLYNQCPFSKYNDVTLGACLTISHVERVHLSSFLSFRPVNLTFTLIVNVVSIHYMTVDDMQMASHIST
ncbi:unnamed protein product [Rotaria magnacalcarata]|uniref:Fringe-like glycosyltransferase domain-containing protein n=1 Tax=Rotaria magnacalcarata TaxID=392030 RepID=A0A816TPN1_9BILA|nr:unnamed protein product [Rotaria magnacalcarata]